MYHPPSKKVRLWRHFSAITIMTLVVLVGVAVLTSLTLGYRFNQKDGRIEQGGILQLNSQPSGATVTINNTPFGSQTPTKLVSRPGDYAITLNRDGYRQWQKTIPIQAGNITWVTYPRLIPQVLTPEKQVSFPASTGSALASPSSKRYAIVSQPNTPMVTLATLDSEKVTTKDYILPQTFYTAPTEEHPDSTFTIESWTGDEKRILLKHTYGDGQHEWLILDLAKPEDSLNVNRMFGLSSTVEKPVFSEGNGSVIYALVDDAVRILNLRDETMSRPLVEQAVDFRLYGDGFVLYVANSVNDSEGAKPSQHVGYVKKGYPEPRIVKTLDYDGVHNAQFAVGKYYDKYYYLVSHGHKAELFASAAMPDNHTSRLSLKSVYEFKLDKPIIDINVTGSGQFATVQDGYGFATYNLEVNQASSTRFAEGSNPLPQKLSYLDGYLLWGSRDGQLRTYEFDGANQQDIMPIIPELGATLSPSAKYLYGFAHDNGEIALMRVQLLDIKP